jgi:hypothetical protein
MNGTQDSLSVFSKLSEELKNVPRGLRVQPRSRFIEEQEQFGLGNELDTNSQSLSLFDVES